MTKVKILTVSDASKAGKNAGAGTPPFCTDSQYVGQVGDENGIVGELYSGRVFYQAVRFGDSTNWLFTPEQLQEVAE